MVDESDCWDKDTGLKNKQTKQTKNQNKTKYKQTKIWGNCLYHPHYTRYVRTCLGSRMRTLASPNSIKLFIKDIGREN